MSTHHCSRGLARLFAAACAFVFITTFPSLAGPWEDGVGSYQRGDYQSALQLWQPLADAGDPRAKQRAGREASMAGG